MSDTTANLDKSEILHLAIEAARRDEHAAALNYLKQGIERFPDDAPMHYMLGAEYAQIELYDRAEEFMARAIELGPELHTARFQLGLLQMTQARVDDARSTWAALDALPEAHALRLYKSGLEALAIDDFAAARTLLQQGLNAKGGSPELSGDMSGVLERIPSEDAAPSGAETQETEDVGNAHVLLNAYRSPDEPHN